MKNNKLSIFNTPICCALISSCILSFSSFANPVPDTPTADDSNPEAIVALPTAPEVAAASYVLMDYHSGKIIAEKNMHERRLPASLTKMMTSYVIGQEMKAGNIKNEDIVTISNNAWAQNPVFRGSSKMFLEVNKTVTVGELNQGIVISSGNDACVAMAEHIAGSEQSFTNMMNQWAQRIGMNDSYFVNSHGLDSEEHHSTAYDLALLGQALIRDVPEEYSLYSQKEFTYNGIKQYNRNTLLWDESMKVDGIKTGHTDGAGYNLVTSAVDGDMRLISVVMGTASENARAAETKKLLNYGFRFFETVSPHSASDVIASEKIWMGDKNTIDLGVADDTYVTITRNQAQNLTAKMQLDNTLKAPIQAGDVVGKVIYQVSGEDVAQYDVIAKETVEEGGFFSRLWDYILLFFSSLF